MKVRAMMTEREWRAQGRGADVSQLTHCNVRVYGRPERPEHEDVAEHLDAMRADEVDDEAIHQHYAFVARARHQFFLLDLTRAEAAFLGERMEFGAEHRTLYWDIPPRITQAVEERERAKHTLTREDLGMREVLVLDDPDEMLPEEVVWEHAWDLTDELGP